MPFVNRFFLNENGGATFTGNTLGLSRSEAVGVPGTVDSIGGFVTTNTALTFGAYPAGTTGSYLLNSSSAVLVLPPGATVIYAELIWGGTYINNGVDLSAFINDAVGFTTSMGTFSISPVPATAQEVTLSAGTRAYVRSAEVTSIVAASGAGTYTTSSVVGTIVIPDPTSNHAGWTLAVFYSDPAAPLRNLSLRVGATVIQATSGPVDTVLTGFATPFAGALNGRTQISAQEGDANKNGDRYLFGPTVASLTALSGPNNFVNNFFASQINNDAGLLDTTGTFGTRNQINGAPGSNIVGGRQGWDITNVTISPTLLNSQTSAVFRLTTNGDGYLVDGIGIQIDILEPLVQVEKSANKTATVLGDVVTYTAVIRNTGLVSATAVQFFDTDIDGADFVPGSFRINGVQQPGADPVLGVPIGTILAGMSVTVTFDEVVVSLPMPPILRNQATAAYSFVPTPEAPPISTVVPSNIVDIPEFLPLLAVRKEANLANALVGDTITYTLTITNVGNIQATGLVTDPLPPGTLFVLGTVFVNGVNRPSDNPNLGIDIGVLDLVQTTAITYQLLVTAVPPEGVVRNRFGTAFEVILPDGRTIPGFIPSNEVVIPVSSPLLTPVKSANLPSAVVGDVVQYTVNVTNNNASALTAVSLTDNVPNGSTFVTGSVTVGGIPVPGASPLTGIPIGTLAPGATVLVTFQIVVAFLPDPAVLTDQATVSFTSGSATQSSNSNPVTIPVVAPGLTLVKRAGVAIANVGDVVNYSVSALNTGNIDLSAVIFDPLYALGSFVPNSVRTDGALSPGTSPLTGIPVGPIPPGGTVVVSYDVLITAPSPTQFYINQANATFAYTPPGRPPLSGSTTSNIVEVRNPQFTLLAEKSVSSNSVLIGDTITYTVVVTNIGIADSLNTIVSDTATEGGEFVPGSVRVNGAPVAGSIRSGVNIGTVPAGGSAIVTFDVLIVSDPPPDGIIDDFATVTYTSGGIGQSSISNTVTVIVSQPVVVAVKASLDPFAFVGDNVQYTTTVTNTGNFNALATWFDILPEGTSFVENSVTLNGFPVPGANRFTGTFLGTLLPDIENLITFQLKVEFYPPSGVLVNQGNMVLEFILPDGRAFTERVFTNVVTVPVLAPPTIVKSANVTEALVGSKVVFTVAVSNPGSTPFDRATLHDILPEGLEFVPGSVTVGGSPVPTANPAIGIPAGFIAPKTSVSVKFEATAVREPHNLLAVNTASLTFEYVAPNGQRVPGVVQSNPVTILINEEEE
ncbi:DUF7507 domain-containing protein [Paenibacillus sacheonensis]|uniref:DUF11 domain-containing protein n=1 Tax=Paenibacillus sacheonensis TaxID=742054 RepID=A0A7X4YR23_9BACL|nr:DUF11 domain-containing protein [Paenibacillus sacheonensis]MBM7567101.1 putative repeat protein (TIGR01451 family) [Paenibacillus sacheonensis]NBC70970.1 DUF11 domain-containing protein [Paenibacillus sacheonensis]